MIYRIEMYDHYGLNYGPSLRYRVVADRFKIVSTPIAENLSMERAEMIASALEAALKRETENDIAG